MNSLFRLDKRIVTEFLDNATRILETAVEARSQDPGEVAILIGAEGGIQIVMNSGWALDALQRHHGASAGYRVSRNAAGVRVEGKSRTQSCLLESASANAMARNILSDRPRYLLT